MRFAPEPPHLTQQPDDVVAPVGDTAAFACRAAGQPEPDISWTMNDVEVTALDPRFHRMPDGSLRILSVDASCVGHYECRANNSVGVVRSRRARMVIDGADKAGNDPRAAPQRPTIVLAPLGGKMSSRHPLVLHCIANGELSDALRWLRNAI